MMRRLVLALVALAAPAGAQSLNIDFGSPAHGEPGSAYGGAAGQPGFWAAVDALTGASSIPQLDGSPSNFAIHVGGGMGNGYFDHPATSGDDGLLYDDHVAVGLTFSSAFLYCFSLEPGTYDVYTHAWSPYDASYRTTITLQPSPDPPQVVGGAWTGTHEPGVTYAKHRLEGGGTFVIVCTSSVGEGAVNAVQFVKLPDGPVGQAFCGPANANSTGGPAAIHATGSAVAADDHLSLLATSLPPNQFGYFLVSATQGFVANPGGSQGNLCLGGTIGRFSQLVQSSGAAGEIGIQIDLRALPLTPPHAVQAGETWNFQGWYRDLNPGATSNFTDGVSVAFL